MTLSLDWLPATAYLFLLVFARIGTMLMLVPGLGEAMIPARFRLSFALMATLALLPILERYFPPMPEFGAAMIIMFHEIAVGLILGAITRFVTLATSVAGSIIAFQSGLSFAQSADPTNAGIQGAAIGSFLGILGAALVFATDLHHVALAAIFDSYMTFPPSAPLMFDDALQLALKAISSAFIIGLQMSAPFIVFGLVFSVGQGILNRLMPQLQVYFLLMPGNVFLGIILFAVLLTMMMGWYLSHFEGQLAILRGR